MTDSPKTTRAPSAGERGQQEGGRGGQRTRVGLALAAGAALMLLMAPAQADKPAKVVEAERFVLRNAEGQVRAELRLEGGEPSLVLCDTKGNRRAGLAVLPDGSASLSLHDKQGTGRAVLSLQADGESRLNFYDESGKLQISLPGVVEAGPSRPADQEVERIVPAVAPEATARFNKAERVYTRLCAFCHDADGRGTEERERGSTPPDFTNPRWHASRTDAALKVSILDGKGEKMPSYADRLSAEQALDLVVYLRAFNPRNSPPAEGSLSDFERRHQQLQKEWDALDKQYKALIATPRKP